MFYSVHSLPSMHLLIWYTFSNNYVKQGRERAAGFTWRLQSTHSRAEGDMWSWYKEIIDSHHHHVWMYAMITSDTDVPNPHSLNYPHSRPKGCMFLFFLKQVTVKPHFRSKSLCNARPSELCPSTLLRIEMHYLKIAIGKACHKTSSKTVDK